MTIKRRVFINLSAIATTTGIITGFNPCTSKGQAEEKKSAHVNLQSMVTDVVPITVQEREAA